MHVEPPLVKLIPSDAPCGVKVGDVSPEDDEDESGAGYSASRPTGLCIPYVT